MILFDGIIYKLQSSGGVSVVFNELLSRLPRESYTLLGFKEEPPLNLSSENYIYESPRILERYRRALISHNFDLFHSTYYRLPAVKSCKVVTTVHDYTYERFASGFRRAVHSFQKRKCISESDKIICVSENTRQDLLEFSGASYEERTVVIHNGVSSDYYFRPEIDTEPQLIFVGARSGYKNFKSVVYALSSIEDINLVCVGGGGLSRTELKFLEKYLSGRYRHTGYLTNSELNLEYNRSLCLIYPSMYEGFGIPILEAMRAGCPVIAINSSSIPEVAGEAAILMDTGEPDEILNALKSIMFSTVRDDLVVKGLAQSKKFTWDETFKKTLDVYEELLGKNI